MENSEQLSKEELSSAKKQYNFTYQTKNLINGKTYIGVHSTDNLKDGYIGSGKALLNSIKKYGKENFSMIILDFFSSPAEAFEEEKILVNEEWIKNKNNYNMSVGGFGGNLGEIVNKKRSKSIRGRKHSDEAKINMSTAAIGRKINKKTREKMSISQKGRKHSEETKEKIREANLGKRMSKKTIEAVSKANSGENNIKFKTKTSGLPLYICNHNSKENPFIVRYKGKRIGVYPTLRQAIQGKEDFLNNLK